jgi:DNA-binding CsgD family transcriptional regulator
MKLIQNSLTTAKMFSDYLTQLERKLGVKGSKQASWRPQRQHNYSNKRTLTIAQHQEKHMSGNITYAEIGITEHQLLESIL